MLYSTHLRLASPAWQYLRQHAAQIGRDGFRQLQDTRYICLLLTTQPRPVWRRRRTDVREVLDGLEAVGLLRASVNYQDAVEGYALEHLGRAHLGKAKT